MKKAGDYTRFDVIAYLDNRGIDYAHAGHDIAPGWIGIPCPYCGCHGRHGGIKLGPNTFSCWICNETATALGLICTLEGFQGRDKWKKAGAVVRQFSTGTAKPAEYYIKRPTPGLTSAILPIGRIPMPRRAYAYLRDRGFDPDYLVERYGLSFTGDGAFVEHQQQVWDNFQYRVVIPVYYGKTLVSYTCRDYTEEQHDRYRGCPTECSIVPLKSCIYNIQSVKDRALLVEGPTDTWMMGDETIGVFGKKITPEQIHTIFKLRLNKVVVFFDNDTFDDDGEQQKGDYDEAAERFATELSAFIPEVLVASPENFKDAGTLNFKDAQRIKYELLAS